MASLHSTDSKAGNPLCDLCGSQLYRLDGGLRDMRYGSIVCDAAIAAEVAAAVAARDADREARELAEHYADPSCDTPFDCPHVHDAHGNHVSSEL